MLRSGLWGGLYRLIVFHSGLWYAFIALGVWDHSHAEAVASHWVTLPLTSFLKRFQRRFITLKRQVLSGPLSDTWWIFSIDNITFRYFLHFFFRPVTWFVLTLTVFSNFFRTHCTPCSNVSDFSLANSSGNYLIGARYKDWTENDWKAANVQRKNLKGPQKAGELLLKTFLKKKNSKHIWQNMKKWRETLSHSRVHSA